MKSLWNDADRNEILMRIDRVADGAPARWGTLSADRMLAHLGESMKMANGEVRPKPKKLPIRFFPLKQLILYVLPFPKGAPTAPELLAGAAAPVTALAPALRQQIDSFASKAGLKSWPEHPAFGHLTKRDWGVLTYRHLDHHLRQFGA
jgi:hypothetical protein